LISLDGLCPPVVVVVTIPPRPPLPLLETIFGVLFVVIAFFMTFVSLVSSRPRLLDMLLRRCLWSEEEKTKVLFPPKKTACITRRLFPVSPSWRRYLAVTASSVPSERVGVL